MRAVSFHPKRCVQTLLPLRKRTTLMTCHPPKLLFCLGLLATTVTLAEPASATLGESADSVAKDRKALAASAGASTTHPNYTVQQIVSDATTVREYVDSSGIVFGVAWNGRVHPNLNQLLGGYATQFQQAKRRLPRKHGQKSLAVQGEQVVVETWGHMRNLQGRAYLPALIPEGVNANEIK